MDQKEIRHSKAYLRKKILRERELPSREEISAKSRIIWDKLKKTKEFESSGLIFFFVGYKSEVQTDFMIMESLELGKKVAVPRVLGKEGMAFYEIQDLEGLAPGFKGIPEPRCGLTPTLELPDLILVPGAVFDKKGYRIGYGGGYYDRFLEKVPTEIPAIGLIFSLQLLPEIPREAHDIAVNYILTEEEMIIV